MQVSLVTEIISLQPYGPKMKESLSYPDIMRTVHNYILVGKDGKTPAVRLGLAQAPLDYEDIIYFSSTD
jgi:hypothetical protein